MVHRSRPWTRKYFERVYALDVEVGVSVPFTGQEDEIMMERFRFIWDTGATSSVITPKIVRKLGLKPIDRTTVYTSDHSSEKDVYLVNLSLPNNETIQAIRVTEANLASPDLDGLIGMDIIGSGDFSVTHGKGVTVVSFRTPPFVETDYVQEQREAKAAL